MSWIHHLDSLQIEEKPYTFRLLYWLHAMIQQGGDAVKIFCFFLLEYVERFEQLKEGALARQYTLISAKLLSIC